MSFYLVYVTCRDHEEARAIASAAVEKRLAACANIFQPHESVYWWDGAVQNDTETAMVLKTPAVRFDALKAEILRLHSYDVPCITAVPIAAGHDAFLSWVAENARSA